MKARVANRATSIDDRWYSGISRYQWTVLVIASLGWVFDAFEGQIFVSSMNETIPSLVPPGTNPGRIALYNNVALGAFLLGGALGGIVFGVLSDRVGRKRTLSWTILFYSVFTCLSAFSQEWWHLAGFRFLVALGVGGEWAVAGALVAEVFPAKARAHVASLFHASSVLGVYLAIAAATLFIGSPAIQSWAQSMRAPWLLQYVDPGTLPWRLTFVLGVLPALLIIWIRRSLREPESWTAAKARSAIAADEPMGAISDLFRGELLRRTCVGVILAATGLATFWGAHIYGKDMMRQAAEQEFALGQTANPTMAANNGSAAQQASQETQARGAALKRWEMLGMFLVTTGGGIGLVTFGPLSQRVGRRGAFLLFQLGGLATSLLIFQVIEDFYALVIALPVFGFLTLGMHAGFAVYFPELYPTRLRGTGAGFCFNAGRILAAPTLFAIGWLQNEYGLSLANSATLLSLLFLVGIAVLIAAPETRGRELSN
jgi:MFS family permease